MICRTGSEKGQTYVKKPLRKLKKESRCEMMLGNIYNKQNYRFVSVEKLPSIWKIQGQTL